MKKILTPLALIALGIARLMLVRNMTPEGVDIMAALGWILGLAIVGAALFAWRGTSKFRLAAGVWCLVAAVLGLLAYFAVIPHDYELPILIILGGALWLVFEFLPNPKKKVVIPPPDTSQQVD